MTDPIRAAAQALLDACDEDRRYGTLTCRMQDLSEALRAALSSPRPAADERVAEHMRTVAEYKRIALLHQSEHGQMIQEYQRQKVDAWAAVESSARALLSAGLEDAEMLDWVLEHRARIVKLHDELPVYAHYWDSQGEHHGPDAATPRAAIRAAMKGTQ